MLVLSRRKNDSILIGDDIKILITEVRGGVVRLGIDAPKELRIMRHELLPEKGATNNGETSEE